MNPFSPLFLINIAIGIPYVNSYSGHGNIRSITFIDASLVFIFLQYDATLRIKIHTQSILNVDLIQSSVTIQIPGIKKVLSIIYDMNENSITYLVNTDNDIIFNTKSGEVLRGLYTTVNILYI